MWKATLLFSLLTLSLLAQDLKESIELSVKVVDRLEIEKEKLIPPERLSLPQDFQILDLSYELIEPPKDIEEKHLTVPEDIKGCGTPKDRRIFAKALKLYQEGKLLRAREKLYDLISIQNSPFSLEGRYLLAVIELQRGEKETAVILLRENCPGHPASCETLYAIEFQKDLKPPEAKHHPFWRSIHEAYRRKALPDVNCSETIFELYCSYLRDLKEGKINDLYPESTEIRKAILLLDEDPQEAKSVFEKYTKGRFRDIALYYLGVLAFKEGSFRKTYEIASLLSLSREDLSNNLLLIASYGDKWIGRIAYRVTQDKRSLRNAGIIAYNEGSYGEAYEDFIRSGEFLYAAFSAIREGSYERAYEALSRVEDPLKEHYLWMLESLYWLGKFDAMARILEKIKTTYPEVYNQFAGWILLKVGDWAKAYEVFQEPYTKAVALFNWGRYGDVLKLLKEDRSDRARILKARSAIAMGNGKLAREFLKGGNPLEDYLIGMSYFIEGNYLKASEIFSDLVYDKRVGTKALLKLADSLYNAGDYTRAKNLYLQILKEKPDSVEATEALMALAQIELQNPSKDLKEIATKIMEKFPNSPFIPDLKYQLAQVYLKEGNKEKAKEILKDLFKEPRYRAKALLKLAQIEENLTEKEKLLKEAIKHGIGEDKKKATELLKDLYLKEGNYEKLADFLAKGSYEERKEALKIYVNKNPEKAVPLFNQLFEKNPNDEDLKKVALDLFRSTGKIKYLDIALEAQDPQVRTRALYLKGLSLKDKKPRKALEYFVEVILSAEGVQPYYNKSIIHASEILLKLGAKRDASCLLEKIDMKRIYKEDLKKVKILRKKLPKCEVKGNGTSS